MHSVREFVEAAFRHIGKEIEWEGEAEAEVGKEKGTGIVRVKVNPKYYRPTEVEQLQVSENIIWSSINDFGATTNLRKNLFQMNRAPIPSFCSSIMRDIIAFGKYLPR